MALDTYAKSEWISLLLEDAKAASVTFLQILSASSRQAKSIVNTGLLAVEAAANGQTMRFAVPDGVTALGPQGVMSLNGELRKRFANASAYLTETGIDTPTDDQITTQMLADMEPLRHAPADFSQMIR